MPLPVAHGLLAASVVVVLREPTQSRPWKLLLIGVFLGISPDLDYALNFLRVGSGGWHHGFTHSIVFAVFCGLIATLIAGERRLRNLILFTGATVSHTLLDYLITESRGVALWWPFTDYRYKLRLPNPIDYTWSTTSLSEMMVDLLRICLVELMIFGPLVVVVVLLKRLITQRGRSSTQAPSS